MLEVVVEQCHYVEELEFVEKVFAKVLDLEQVQLEVVADLVLVQVVVEVDLEDFLLNQCQYWRCRPSMISPVRLFLPVVDPDEKRTRRS